MKLFISWSGPLSQQIAAELRDWLPHVIQRVQPYFTPTDTDKGAIWFSEIVNELNQSKVGIICVTPDSLQSPWVHFEAGAISIAVQEGKICPILFSMNKGQLRGPLAQFQSIEFEKDEFKGLMTTINNEQDDNDRLKDSVLDNTLEVWWPKLAQNINTIIRDYRPEKLKPKTTEENHDEIMGMLRGIRELRAHDLTQHVAEDTFINIYNNIDAAFAGRDRIDQVEALWMLARNVEYLHMRLHKSRVHSERAERLLERLTHEKTRLESQGRVDHSQPDEEVPF
jgi:TIR domain